MEKHTGYINDRFGNAIGGASVRILKSDGTPAAIFSSTAGGPIANPITSNANGKYSFAAANGTYSAEISYGGTLYDTVDGIVLFDGSVLNVDTSPFATTAQLAASTGASQVGMASGGTVQQAIDARATLAQLAAPTGSGRIGHGSGTVATELASLATTSKSGAAALDELATSNGTSYVWGSWYGNQVAQVSDLALPGGAGMIGYGNVSIAQALDTNTANITSNTASISSNTASINTNTTDISSNTAAINTNAANIDSVIHPPATTTPATLGELRFEKTSDTQLTVRLKGGDGIVRSVVLTLA